MASSTYAEALLNIRQTTLCISLPSPHDTTTKLTLSPDRKILEVHHQSRIATVRLPIAVANSASLKLPHQPTKEVSLRLPFATDTRPVSLCRTHQRCPAWSAKALADVQEVFCQACGHVWICASRIKHWKNLPNEDWAEMMDLWHCHKPPNPTAENGAGSTGANGYAASAKLVAQSGVGLVGVSSVLFSPEDCSGLQV